MSEKSYQPIACGLHESYQLAAMRRSRVDLAWWQAAGGQRQARVRVEDVITRSQAEYLRVITQTGEAMDIRLDSIISAHWAASGEPLGS